MPFVYLLHFERRYPRGRRPQHYVGVTVDINKRMAEHRAGNPGKAGSLMRAVAAEGIAFEIARCWEFPTSKETFDWERRLKKRRQHAQFCSICLHAAKQQQTEDKNARGSRQKTTEG